MKQTMEWLGPKLIETRVHSLIQRGKICVDIIYIYGLNQHLNLLLLEIHFLCQV